MNTATTVFLLVVLVLTLTIGAAATGALVIKVGATMLLAGWTLRWATRFKETYGDEYDGNDWEEDEDD